MTLKISEEKGRCIEFIYTHIQHLVVAFFFWKGAISKKKARWPTLSLCFLYLLSSNPKKIGPDYLSYQVKTRMCLTLATWSNRWSNYYRKAQRRHRGAQRRNPGRSHRTQPYSCELHVSRRYRNPLHLFLSCLADEERQEMWISKKGKTRLFPWVGIN